MGEGRQIKTYYCDINNAGDQLTPLIVKSLFQQTVQHKIPCFAELIGIGSILDSLSFCTKITSKGKIKRLICAILSKLSFQGKTNVWGTGFMCRNGGVPKKFWIRNIEFHAVRGKMTKEIVERIYKPIPNVVLADAGLLSSMIVEKQKKKYSVGIIPHCGEMDYPIVPKLVENYENSLLIDMRSQPEEVLKKISQCEYVVASSLHGLIIADSYGIPNIRIIIGENTVEQNFKYRDYYSSFDLEEKNFDLRFEGKIPTINDIIDNYEIKYDDVLEKQKQLIDVFPFK